jgi:hypothetical protein
VTPLVVLWGEAQQGIPEDAEVDGVVLVGGRGLTRWLKACEGEWVDRRAARDLLKRLETFRSEAWGPNAARIGRLLGS